MMFVNMKKLLVLSAFFAMVSGGAASAATSVDGILTLNGSVASQLAIDIVSDSCDALNQNCSKAVGELTAGYVSQNVGTIGVLSNDGYRVRFYSDNGGFKGQATGNSSQLQPYKLAWEVITAAVTAPLGSAAIKGLQPTATAVGSYECSLFAGCPQAATARHNILLSTAINQALSSGAYQDKVHFHIVNAEDPAAALP